jgi:hypothetical protein
VDIGPYSFSQHWRYTVGPCIIARSLLRPKICVLMAMNVNDCNIVFLSYIVHPSLRLQNVQVRSNSI